MKLDKKIKYLQDNHFGEWLRVRKICIDEVSAKQSTFCVCGGLATISHISSCRRFNAKINSETVKKLNYLKAPLTK
jgi:hypothetical protein